MIVCYNKLIKSRIPWCDKVVQIAIMETICEQLLDDSVTFSLKEKKLGLFGI